MKRTTFSAHASCVTFLHLPAFFPAALVYGLACFCSANVALFTYLDILNASTGVVILAGFDLFLFVLNIFIESLRYADGRKFRCWRTACCGAVYDRARYMAFEGIDLGWGGGFRIGARWGRRSYMLWTLLGGGERKQVNVKM